MPHVRMAQVSFGRWNGLSTGRLKAGRAAEACAFCLSQISEAACSFIWTCTLMRTLAAAFFMAIASLVLRRQASLWCLSFSRDIGRMPRPRCGTWLSRESASEMAHTSTLRAASSLQCQTRQGLLARYGRIRRNVSHSLEQSTLAAAEVSVVGLAEEQKLRMLVHTESIEWVDSLCASIGDEAPMLGSPSRSQYCLDQLRIDTKTCSLRSPAARSTVWTATRTVAGPKWLPSAT